MTKREFIERVNQIAAEGNSHDNGYHYQVVVNDWQNYGKDRTYVSIIETRNGSKHYAKKDYGFFDNIAGTFVEGKASLNYTFSGARM